MNNPTLICPICRSAAIELVRCRHIGCTMELPSCASCDAEGKTAKWRDLHEKDCRWAPSDFLKMSAEAFPETALAVPAKVA